MKSQSGTKCGKPAPSRTRRVEHGLRYRLQLSSFCLDSSRATQYVFCISNVGGAKKIQLIELPRINLLKPTGYVMHQQV
jgi:hypothetical protein